ncbi:hypothetical protein [Jidongwangia harbinensis]|uniref:hypothetical protein n=1 Tax=Jidongwangia harbinensis TaxID=2878561 RepID=UPI001CD93270|nr:hypothetical protein [Jidongwangia harbinensis]MCA2214174.1 hypothetical protein [Jidongwangia harbinensis]
MTTRRDLFLLGGGLVAAATTGCREPARTPAAGPAVTVPDVLVAESGTGLVILGGTRRHLLGPAAAVRPDGGLAYAVTRDPDGGSGLVRIDPADGVPTRSGTLGGGWVPRAVSADGRACALGRHLPSARPAGRARTALLVTTDGRQRRYDLAGVVEPDAFTSDGAGLFVLEWLPPHAPDRYRVRLLDLASGRVTPLLTRAKATVPPGAEEEMRGDGRHAVLSPDRHLLYTLYTHQPGHRHTRDLLSGRPGGVHAFVHVLHLTERWAYCLDLPHPFGTGPADGHAVAVSEDGRRLAVVDVTSGALAYADTGTLRIDRVDPVPAGRGPAGLALAADGRQTFVGAGASVTVLDSGTGAVTARWPVPGPVRGLGLSPDATRLYAGGTDEVVWLDRGTGALHGRVPVAGLTALRHVRRR